MANELDTETLVSRALGRLREAQSLLESRSGESISRSAVAVLDAAGDLTTAWGKHLAGLPAPKAEEERKALLAAGGSAGGDDLTTLVSQLLGAPDTQASTVTSVTVTDYVAVGANPAQSGAIRLGNNQAIMARNFTNTGDSRVIIFDSGEAIRIGPGTGFCYFTGMAILPQWIQVIETSPLSAPGADKANLWLEDNGSGKSRFMIQFATGAPIQMAIQP